MMKSVIALLALIALTSAQDQFKCSQKTGRSASNYGISDHARDFMMISSEGSQTKSSFKAIECECDDTDEQTVIWAIKM